MIQHATTRSATVLYLIDNTHNNIIICDGMKCGESPVALYGVQVVGGSNPLAPTIKSKASV
jgi:hypothetical protein